MNPLRRFRDLSIESKLRLVIMLVCVAALLPTCAAYIAFKWHHHRVLMISTMAVRSQVLAANVSGPLAFRSAEDAAEVLAALAVDRDIAVAGVFDSTGEVLAGYPAKRSVERIRFRPVATVEHHFAGDGLWVWAPVRHGDRTLGALVMRNSLGQMHSAIASVAAVSAGLLLLALAVSFLVATRFQRVISSPLLALAEVARQVGITRNFALRVPPMGDDEIGLVARQFNTALAAIQEHEAALRESEARKGAIVESALDAIVTIDHTGRICEFNPAAEKLFGYTTAQAVGRELAELIIPPSHRERHRQGMARFLVTGKSKVLGSRIEMPALRADGAELQVELAITRIGTGEPLVFTGFIRDITEARRAEKAMQESEERFRTLTVATAQIVWTTNAAGEVAGPLPGWQAFTGQTDVEIRGAGWIAAVHPEDAPSTAEAWKRALEGRGIYEVEYRLRRHDGVYRHFSVRGVPVRNADGSIREWVGTCTDVTRRKQAETELRHSAERLTALNRLDRIISSKLDLERVFEAFAREMSALIKCDRAALIVVKPEADEWEVAHRWAGGDAPPPAATCGPLANSGFGWVAEQKRALVEVRISSSWSEAPLLRQSGLASRALFPLVLEDRTAAVFAVASRETCAFDREAVDFMQALADQLAVALQNIRLYAEVRRHAAELERRVEERTAELVAANRELEAFSYSISHDLRAPLRAVAGFARILVDEHGPKSSPEVVRYLAMIQDGAQRMGQLIDELLAFSRLSRQAMTKAKVDLAHLSREVLQSLAHEIKGRQVDVRIAELPAVEADAILVRQVMVNLLSNALKYSQPRTRAVIEVGVTTADHGGDGPVFYVRDNGVGFDMRHAGKLFGVFQRLHRTDEFEGTGVGLAIAQRIIHRHGGRIWAQARPEEGATFFFTLSAHNGDHPHENLPQ